MLYAVAFLIVRGVDKCKQARYFPFEEVNASQVVFTMSWLVKIIGLMTA